MQASTINQNVSQKLYDALQNMSEGYVTLGVVFMIGKLAGNHCCWDGQNIFTHVGFGICVFSLLCAIFLGLFDRRAERILKTENDVMEKITCRDVIKFPLELWLLIIVCVIYYTTVDPFLGLAVYVFCHLSVSLSLSLSLSPTSILDTESPVSNCMQQFKCSHSKCLFNIQVHYRPQVHNPLQGTPIPLFYWRKLHPV